MGNYVVIKTSSGMRTSILSDFIGYTLEKFIEISGTIKPYSLQYRVVNLDTNQGATKLNSLSVSQFEDIFMEDGVCKLTPQVVSDLFGYKVKTKYGMESELKKQKTIPEKDLEFGKVYKDVSNRYFVYLGKAIITDFYHEGKTQERFIIKSKPKYIYHQLEENELNKERHLIQEINDGNRNNPFREFQSQTGDEVCMFSRTTDLLTKKRFVEKIELENNKIVVDKNIVYPNIEYNFLHIKP